MSSYPNPDDPNQPNQYPPAQGQPGAQYSGGYQTPPSPSSPYEQPYQQQPSYPQSSPYEQPYQQPPYQQQPPPYQSPYPTPPAIKFDWRYITAGIGGLVAAIAFFLPYSLIGLYGYNSGFRQGHQLILDFIIAIAALAIAAFLQFGQQVSKAQISPAIQKLTNSFNTDQQRWGLILMLIGIFGFFFRFVLDLGTLSYWQVGSWLYTVGVIAVAVGGFFIYRPPVPPPTQAPPTP